MQTRIIMEGLLYGAENPTTQLGIRKALTLCHIINDSDRDYMPTEHMELFYLNHFKRPNFLVVVDKRLHVFLLGAKDKGLTYNIIEVEGFTAEHMVLSKGELIARIRALCAEDKKMFLPDAHTQRIIFIQPDYKANTDIITEDNVFIFNRVSSRSTLFAKSNWTLGYNIYNVTEKEYRTSAKEILKSILASI